MSRNNKKSNKKVGSMLQAHQLKVGSMYCCVNQYSLCLFKTSEESLMDDYEEVVGSLGPKEPFLLVEVTSLLKDKPCSNKKHIIKVVAGDKMGWTNILEGRHRFKIFDEAMAAEYEELKLGWSDEKSAVRRGAQFYVKPMGKNFTWSFNSR